MLSQLPHAIVTFKFIVRERKLIAEFKANSKYKRTNVFSTQVVSLHRACDTEPQNQENLWGGEPLLKKFDDETPKKV